MDRALVSQTRPALLVRSTPTHGGSQECRAGSAGTAPLASARAEAAPLAWEGDAHSTLCEFASCIMLYKNTYLYLPNCRVHIRYVCMYLIVVAIIDSYCYVIIILVVVIGI